MQSSLGAILEQDRNFDGLSLRGLNLCNANLTDASFIGADLSGANLQDADLSRAAQRAGLPYKPILTCF
ncbi:pentapeptide repeat-containing protein [Halotia branconii]|uniref:Pentapeptide repeat-containing protein n=1 Tax=Halotia branconii CENA392 TaxID=1539056 RepID=A0AAJ6NSG8_9CYAN|nr:pentapeptide repeat-containing protein [Halotia branconii]WGV25578.1 pentapeptide repeat-containing protein [Halotia branconii CENA392]